MIGSSIRSWLRVKSPEMGVQLLPLSSLRQTRYDAVRIRVGWWKLTSMGVSQLNRSNGSPSRAWGWMYTASPVIRSVRHMTPCWNSP